MTTRALAYAEDILGVHRVWANSEQLIVRIADLHRTKAGLETESRALATQLDERRQFLLVEEWKKCGDMPVTAFERHMKLVLAQDEDLKKLVERSNEIMAHRDSVEADIRGAETNMKAHVARMNELAGYFQYLASAKNAQAALDMVRSEWPY